MIAAVLVVGVVFGLRYYNAQAAHTPSRADSTKAPQDTAPTRPESTSTTPDTPTTDDADEPMAEAREVMEAFIALDKVHDGEGMAKLLDGSAAANFRADIQGQSDSETVEEGITAADLVAESVVRFKVRTVSKDLATGELSDVHDFFTVRKTDAGWKITEIQYG